MSSEKFSFMYDARQIAPLDLLPHIYQPISDFRGLANNYGHEIQSLYDGVKYIFDSQYINDASGDVLSKWEKYLKLTPNGTDSLEERRFRILARLNDSPPYTDQYLINKLNELCGKDSWRLHKDYNEYTLIVEVSLDSVTNTETVLNLIRDIIPANLKFVVREYRSRHSELNNFTHNQLAQYTQDEIKYAEMFK